MEKPAINVNFLRGLIESDGSFQIHISGKNFKPIVKFSQKKDDVLAIVAAFLNSKGVTTNFEAINTKTPGGRAGNVRVQGKNNVAKLLDILEEECTDSFLFSGSKQRDFWIMRKITSISLRKPKEIAQGISLKKSLHKTHRADPDIDVTGSKTTKQWEEAFSLPPNSVSQNDELLVEIDESYEKHQKTLTESMSKGTLKVDGGYVAGLMEGDGYYGVLVKFAETSKSEKKRPGNMKWTGKVGLVAEASALLTLKVFLYVLQCEATIVPIYSRKYHEKVTSYKVDVSNQASVRKVIELHETYPLVGADKKARFETVRKLFYLRDNGLLTDSGIVMEFLGEIWRASDAGNRRSREISLDVAIDLAQKRLNK
jgi:hypothetical protein